MSITPISRCRRRAARNELIIKLTSHRSRRSAVNALSHLQPSVKRRRQEPPFARLSSASVRNFPSFSFVSFFVFFVCFFFAILRNRINSAIFNNKTDGHETDTFQSFQNGSGSSVDLILVCFFFYGEIKGKEAGVLLLNAGTATLAECWWPLSGRCRASSGSFCCWSLRRLRPFRRRCRYWRCWRLLRDRKLVHIFYFFLLNE